MIERVGIYGGTFDPVHVGHLAIAEEARWICRLDRVVLVPVGHQPLKPEPHAATGAQRLRMLELACASNAAFVPSDIELRRPPPSYSIDTLEVLQAQFGSAVVIYFILGADALIDLPRWHRVADLVALVQLAVVARPGYTVDLDGLETHVPGIRERITWINGPQLAIASTDLRRRCAAGQPIRYQVPDPVYAYIEEHGLYRI